MTLKDFNLLEVDIYEGEDLVYSGMSEDAPEDMKQRQIKIDGNDGKKLIIKLV